MCIETQVLTKLHYWGLYGSKCITLANLMIALKEASLEDVQEALLILLKEGLIMKRYFCGGEEISLNPKMRTVIESKLGI